MPPFLYMLEQGHGTAQAAVFLYSLVGMPRKKQQDAKTQEAQRCLETGALVYVNCCNVVDRML